MASMRQALDSMIQLSESQRDPRPVESNTTVLIQEAFDRMQSWIGLYVRSHIGSHTCANDFRDRIERRLLNQLGTDQPDSCSLDAAVKNTTKLLVHEDRRSNFKKAQICGSSSEIENVQDPESLHFVSRLELESQIRFIRQRIPAHLLPIIDTLYGFADAEEVTIDNLAAYLGIRRNTLDKRLSRLFKKLRTELSQFR